MQISRFETFIAELAVDSYLKGLARKISIFRYWKKSWFDDANNEIDDSELISDLQLTLKNKLQWRKSESTNAFFPIIDLSSVAVVQFATRTTTKTRNKFQTAINICLDRAQKTFDASHDILTGLLNNTAITEKVLESIEFLTYPREEEQHLETIPVTSKTVTLLAMDIDHFKQVNDTYGHVYGDIVLQALGRRFEISAQQVLKERIENIHKIYVARPSGEEFLILVIGNLDLDASLKLGEFFRQSVCNGPLPSNEEWEAIQSTADEEKSLQLPPLTERNITISVGIASISSRRSLPRKDPAQVFRNRADRALYCAKSGGRNTVRHFDEILTKHGSVLEHKEEVDLVIIDIGREVDVQKGQEFIVYDPQFRGHIPYFYDDGRTRRILGICPKVPIGRIVAFDIQPEISFCKVEEKKCAGLFKLGSSLESVPLGSISHLIHREAFLNEDDFQLNTLKEVTSKCMKADEDGETVMAVVFSMRNEETLLNDRGSVFVNQCLANLYLTIRDVFSDNAYIVKVRDTEFGVVLIGTKPMKMKQLSQEVTKMAEKACKNIAAFCIGLYAGEKTFNIQGDSSNLSCEWALDYADYALAYAKLVDIEENIFDPTTVNGLLYALRRNKQFNKALKDHEELIHRGICYSMSYNQAAICAWEMPNRNSEIVLELLEKAIQLDPGEPLFWANSGFFYYWLGNHEEAYRRFREALRIKPNYEIKEPYLFPFVDAIHKAYLSNKCDLEVDLIRELIQNAKSEAQKDDDQNLLSIFSNMLKHYD